MCWDVRFFVFRGWVGVLGVGDCVILSRSGRDSGEGVKGSSLEVF